MNTNPNQDATIDSWLKQLTAEQKASLLVGMGLTIPGFIEAEQEEKVPGAAGSTYPIPELNIPSMVLSDGPAGVRIAPTREGTDKTFYCTAFPVATLLASSWDTKLVNEVGKAMGAEAREYGVDILLMPGMNLHRDPRGGRNFEYYSEDPLLSGKMAAAVVRGIQSEGVGASIKHYAANNQETNRMLIDTLIDERTLRELYLRGFEIAIEESNPWTVMSSYNQINGTFASHDRWLLTDVLRDEWGYAGFVMTDWFAGSDSVAQMHAGNDMLMPGTPPQKQEILAALESGDLEESVLDTNLKRVLKVMMKTPVYNNYDYSNLPDLQEHAQVARRAAAEGIVLLKNEEGALPLQSNIKIGAYGVGSYDFIAGGTGSGDVNKAYCVSLVEGLQAADFSLDESLMSTYAPYIADQQAKLPKKQFFFELLPPIAEMPLAKALLAASVQNTDIGLITIGRNSGEFQDRDLDGDFYLTEAEQTMLGQVSEAYHDAGKKVVVVLNIGNVVETASWRGQVEAVVLVWQGGQEGGHAVTDVLSGVVNPSGKLPASFPLVYEDVPSANFFPGENKDGAEEQFVGPLSKGFDSKVSYGEGIYVGYRHYCTQQAAVAYPFGFGLSYASFEYRNLQLSATHFKDDLTVTMEVKNSGNVAGREVVQLYVSAPSLEMDKPARELRAFAKTALLQSGESKSLSFTLKQRDLASWSVEKGGWSVESGEYTVQVAASCEDVRLETVFSVGVG